MTSKQPKKTTKKSTSNKKAPVKKAPTKKASAPQKAIINRPEDAARLAVANETKQQFANADRLMKTLVEQPMVVRANDVKSPSIRKRMLAWFKISK